MGPPSRLVAVDLFSGAGGLSYAFHREGYCIAACVDNDPKALDTYRRSFVGRHSPETAVIGGDIRDRAVLDRIRDALAGRPLDILIGGPPCQDFSSACLRRKRKEDRMGLVRDYIRVMQTLRPGSFVFENVPGLLESDGGQHWQTIEKECSALGYRLSHRVLNAEDYGVPQRRRRLFVVGIGHDSPNEFHFPEGSGRRKTVAEVIGRLRPLRAGEVDPNDVDHKARAHTAAIVEYISRIPKKGSWRSCKDLRVLRCHDGHNGHYDVYGRIDPDDVSPTITGGCTNPSRGRFIHPSQHRGLTVREAALLQTFPKEWSFSGGIESASQQVGNAVPILLGRALARSVRRAVGRLPR